MSQKNYCLQYAYFFNGKITKRLTDLANPLFLLVPEARLELARPCGRRILRPQCS